MTRTIEQRPTGEETGPLPVEQRPTQKRPRENKILRGLGIAAAALLVGGAAGWAGATAFAPPPQVLAEDAFSTVAVVQGEVGSSITLNTVAEWATDPVALNGATGTVTSVNIEAGEQVEAGQRLYSVNLRPVVAAQGSIPAYQPISPGDTGAQVTQLQQFLTDLGYWTGGTSGRYTPGFAVAVRNWQRAAGYPVDAVVQTGDIVWVPQLPARMSLDQETLAVGRIVAAGSGDVVALGAAPSLTIPMQQSQTRFAPTGTRVIVQTPDGSQWEAVASTHRADQNGDTVIVDLTAPDGGSVCAEECDQLGAEGQTTLLSEIVTMPVQEGLVVPTSAVTTGTDGATFVTDAAGERHDVTLVQSARGTALIEGVDAGLDVRIPATQ